MSLYSGASLFPSPPPIRTMTVHRHGWLMCCRVPSVYFVMGGWPGLTGRVPSVYLRESIGKQIGFTAHGTALYCFQERCSLPKLLIASTAPFLAPLCRACRLSRASPPWRLPGLPDLRENSRLHSQQLNTSNTHYYPPHSQPRALRHTTVLSNIMCPYRSVCGTAAACSSNTIRDSRVAHYYPLCS